MKAFSRLAAACRRWLEHLNGDAAYAAYCRHWTARHAAGTDDAPPSRAEFFRDEQQRRWDGVRRCC